MLSQSRQSTYWFNLILIATDLQDGKVKFDYICFRMLTKTQNRLDSKVELLILKG